MACSAFVRTMATECLAACVAVARPSSRNSAAESAALWICLLVLSRDSLIESMAWKQSKRSNLLSARAALALADQRDRCLYPQCCTRMPEPLPVLLDAHAGPRLSKRYKEEQLVDLGEVARPLERPTPNVRSC